jgi:hypothetical protein
MLFDTFKIDVISVVKDSPYRSLDVVTIDLALNSELYCCESGRKAGDLAHHFNMCGVGVGLELPAPGITRTSRIWIA